MSGNVCVYFNCGNNKRRNSEIKFHGFPKNVDVCKKWILNSGKNMMQMHNYVSF